MTMIATVAFPEEIIIMCDSRISYYKGDQKIASNDDLKKLYQLGTNIMIAFTTDDVSTTSKLIEKMTIKAHTILDLDTSQFLKVISAYAKEQYLLIKNKRPKIEFIYAGYDFHSKLKIESRKLQRVINNVKKNGKLPDMLENIVVSKKKFTIFSPPSPILAKQVFPGGGIILTKGWNMGTAGSGESFINDLEKYYPKIFSFPGTFNKAVILKNLADDFVKSVKIDTVGGLIQLFVITPNEISPLQFEEQGSQLQIKTYVDNRGNWVEENITSGERKVVKQK